VSLTLDVACIFLTPEASNFRVKILFSVSSFCVMPKKVAEKKGKKNNQLWTTLPAGARFQLDQLVSLQTEGDSHSEVIRAMVIAQLRIMRRDYDLKLPTVASSPSTDEKPGE
jgi:hypothetical protein